MAVLHPFPSISLSLPQPDLSGTSAWGPSLSSTYFCTSFPLFCDPAGIRATLLMANCLVSQKPRGWKGSFKRCVCDLYLWRILFTVCVCVCCLNTFFLLNACMRWQFFVKEQFVMFSSSALCEVNCKCGKNKPCAYPQMNPPSSQVAFLLSFHPYTGGTVCSETKQCSSRTTMLHKTTH